MGAAPARRRSTRGAPYVIHLADASEFPTGLMEGGFRHLADLAEAGLPVPDGFCVTSAACGLFLGQENLRGGIAGGAARIALGDGLEEMEEGGAGGSTRERILAAPWPEAISRQILEAFASLGRRTGGGLTVSVRAGAAGARGSFRSVGEPPAVPYAGGGTLLEACKAALADRLAAGEAAPPVAIGVTAMADVTASGFLRTRDPLTPSEEIMKVEGSWGWGFPEAEDASGGDLFTLSREGRPLVREARVSRKSRMLLRGEERGPIVVDVPGWMREQPCLNRDQLSLLRHCGTELEKRFGCPQEARWAVDPRERLAILGSRPLPAPGASGGNG